MTIGLDNVPARSLTSIPSAPAHAARQRERCRARGRAYAAMSGDVREHLANERTFLAWVRSSIALIGLGVVIAKLRLSSAEVASKKSSGFHEDGLLGLAFGIVGLFTLLFAAAHYVRTRRMIESGGFRPLGRTVIGFVAVLFLLLGVTGVLYLLGLTAR